MPPRKISGPLASADVILKVLLLNSPPMGETLWHKSSQALLGEICSQRFTGNVLGSADFYQQPCQFRSHVITLLSLLLCLAPLVTRMRISQSILHKDCQNQIEDSKGHKNVTYNIDADEGYPKYVVKVPYQRSSTRRITTISETLKYCKHRAWDRREHYFVKCIYLQSTSVAIHFSRYETVIIHKA
jgi:hypothetical protein